MDSVSIAVQTKQGEVLSVEIPQGAKVQHLEAHIRENIGEEVGGLLCQTRLLGPQESILQGMAGSSVLHCLPNDFAGWFRDGGLEPILGEIVFIMPFLHRSEPCLFVINRIVWFGIRKVKKVDGKITVTKITDALSLEDAKKKVYSYL